MPEDKIQRLTEQDAVTQIVKTVIRAEVGSAPFALVLGSGFSHGLVPTTRELVEESLPLWMKSQNEGRPYEDLKGLKPEERSAIAKEFWSGFVASNRSRGCDLELDFQTGLPKDAPAAYKAAFSSKYFDAVGEPADARRLQRALMRLDQPRLNAAHFLLASLLGVQPGKNRPSALFKARTAFSRLILTTNFDPFLQTALQAVNRLYFMSDTPDLGITDEISDDQTDAIHLVYLHGSIHRRSQAASDEDIRLLKEKNARTLAPVLKRHGVIVLGYSGWDDAIVEALAACDRFDHRLYWCGRETDPLAKGAFGDKVPDILRKPATQYVTIETAGSFMAQLCNGLVNGLPRLLSNPIGQLRELLEAIDLKELDHQAKPKTISEPSLPQLIDSGTSSQNFHLVKESALQRLKEAEHRYFGPFSPATPEVKPTAVSAPPHPDKPANGASDMKSEAAETAKQVEQLLASARLASGLGNHQEALKICDQALAIKELPAPSKIAIWMLLGLQHFFLQRFDDAAATWARVIDFPGAPVEQIAKALVNRGIAWGHKGQTDKAINDYTSVIERQPDAPVEQIARALYNRGFTWGQKGEIDKKLADYTRVIERLPNAPAEQIAWALYNRGVTWGQLGETDKELADYTRLIDHLPGATDVQVAKALSNRGWVYYQQHDYPRFLADTDAALSKDQKLEASAFNLGLALLACGHDARALDAYRRAGEAFPQSIDNLGLEDLAEAQKSWLSAERAAPVIRLLESLKK